MKAYLLRVTAAAILAAVLGRMSGKNAAGRATRLGAGLLVLLTALGPLGSADTVSAAKQLAKWGASDPLTTQNFEMETNQLLSDLISQQAEAYILDKAQELGMQLTVQVTTQVSDTYPVPWQVRLTGQWDQAGREALTQMISQELGVPEERQEWWSM
jgi:hypothetical protein